jgi:micrococcal nuclease
LIPTVEVWTRGALALCLLGACITSASATGVARIVDGDTLVTSEGTTIRLFGIDTPERGECGYDAATRALRRHVGNGPIEWRPPQPERGDRGGRVDKYGRSIGEVFVEGRSVNLSLLKEGFARSTWFSARVDAYRRAEQRARAARRGLWDRCEDF